MREITQSRLNKKSISDALLSKKQVMYAVIMRDMRTRFFDHGLGFLIVPLFPIVHLFILLAVYALLGRDAPFGDDLKVFFATGLIPTLIFIYVSRFMSVSLLENKPMLAFPNVRLLDVVIARSFLEFMAMFIACVVIFTVLVLIDSKPYPHNPATAVLALGSVMVLALGMGICVSVVTVVANVFGTIWSLFMIVVYILSGALFVPAHLPQELAYALSWNPVLHATEWMRVSFYPGYPDQILNETYLMGWALGSVCAGLALERFLRKRLLVGW